jgi:hypothetical protein
MNTIQLKLDAEQTEEVVKYNLTAMISVVASCMESGDRKAIDTLILNPMKRSQLSITDLGAYRDALRDRLDSGVSSEERPYLRYLISGF